jgi:hypothetical protein
MVAGKEAERLAGRVEGNEVEKEEKSEAGKEARK